MKFTKFFYIFAMKGALLGIMVLISVNAAHAAHWGQATFYSTNGTTTPQLYSFPTNTQVGIGTMSPTERLHIVGGALKIGNSTSAADRTAGLLKFGDGSYVKMGEFETDDRLSFYASRGYNFTGGNVGIGTTNPQYKFDVNGIIRGTSNMYINGNVGIGTTAPQYKLDVNGAIRAREIFVNTAGADFVFEKGYALRSLSELRHFIEKNGHLPGVQSAAEMQEKGVSVSELVTTLLQKIEELTLYTIEQKDEIDQLKEDISKIKNQ